MKFCKTKADAKEIAGRMLNNTLVTLQTGPAGRKVQTVYFTVASDIKKARKKPLLLFRSSVAHDRRTNQRLHGTDKSCSDVVLRCFLPEDHRYRSAVAATTK